MSQNLRPPKSCWHPLSLQQLPPNQLVGVVDEILAGRFTLVSYTLHRPPVLLMGPSRIVRPRETD